MNVLDLLAHRWHCMRNCRATMINTQKMQPSSLGPSSGQMDWKDSGSMFCGQTSLYICQINKDKSELRNHRFGLLLKVTTFVETRFVIPNDYIYFDWILSLISKM